MEWIDVPRQWQGQIGTVLQHLSNGSLRLRGQKGKALARCSILRCEDVHIKPIGIAGSNQNSAQLRPLLLRDLIRNEEALHLQKRSLAPRV